MCNVIGSENVNTVKYATFSLPLPKTIVASGVASASLCSATAQGDFVHGEKFRDAQAFPSRPDVHG